MGTRAGAWQPLPDGLPPEVRHLVEQLRRLKDHTGLSLVALGSRTAYSKSSWQRYLNAQQPPPREAVLALCRVAGVDGARPLAGWELAVKVWPRAGEVSGAGAAEVPAPGGRTAGAPAPSPADTPPVAPVRVVRRPAPSWRLVACSALAVIALLLVSLLWIVTQVAGVRGGADEGPSLQPGASVSEPLGTRRAPGTATE
ncbi:hypothetical protein GCM10010349_44680 [Streptomyces flavofungini]|uniref:Helix-turn-helix domain-containing protein n=1 Tax=Streptomyces flavofungini TaxID=68200 RepID=A0ABS0X5I4_9ACTN|nr:helix-turn-helix transcriptional regulator [Streptomyces flavofungini]MBJ3808457.1 helix-turn-helix domain-containing protein [Streptomyces flavofungini]GHC69680.1 hypothetical protein GCM10010349_44680 [Streptomyces flavofungini]